MQYGNFLRMTSEGEIDLLYLIEQIMFPYFLGFVLFIFAIVVFYHACFWIIFKKASLPGRYILLPIVNIYGFFSLAFKQKKYFLTFLFIYFVTFGLFFGASFLSLHSQEPTIFQTLLPLAFVGNLCIILFLVILPFQIAKNFGKSSRYGLGILFLGIFFIPHLAFTQTTFSYKKNIFDYISKNVGGHNTKDT